MSGPEKIYRIYCFDVATNAVSADFLTPASDEEAIAKAEADGFGSKCEIWDGKRLVAKLGADRREA